MLRLEWTEVEVSMVNSWFEEDCEDDEENLDKDVGRYLEQLKTTPCYDRHCQK